MVKLACPEVYVLDNEFVNRVDKIISLGFQAVEIDGQNVNGSERDMIVAIARRKVSVSAIWAAHVTGSLDTDRAVRDESLKELKRLIKFSAEIATAGVVFTDHQMKPSSPEDRHEAVGRLAEYLSEAAAYAKTVGSRVLLEPLAGKFNPLIRTIEDGAALCQIVHSPGLRLCADTYHMSVNGEDIVASLKAFGRYIGHIHLSDLKPPEPGDGRCLPGNGSVDFVSVFQSAKMTAFHGCFAVEGFAPHKDDSDALRKCAEYLNTLK
ncbi:MAG: sugar phosphate isomerase/epimerase family protein [Armatimonadota bacterium]|nr:sugar phosphate isomerase/epimerase family protein [Armatimonadota bacterium]